jgi:hypothetical protein
MFYHRDTESTESEQNRNLKKIKDTSGPVLNYLRLRVLCDLVVIVSFRALLPPLCALLTTQAK